MLLTIAEIILNSCYAILPRPEPKPEALKEIKLIAHRGAHNNTLGIYENTMESFRLAQQAGCWGIELDVHATADDILVVNHDPDLTRLWGQQGVINELNFETLRSLVPQIPSLTEVVAEFGSTLHLFIELKTSIADAALLTQQLNPLSPVQDYHILTLVPEMFSTLSRLPPKALLLVAISNTKVCCDLSIKKHYGGVMGSYFLMTSKRINQLLQADQIPGVGFVNSKNTLWREINRGVKWIFTNQAINVGADLRQLKLKIHNGPPLDKD